MNFYNFPSVAKNSVLSILVQVFEKFEKSFAPFSQSKFKYLWKLFLSRILHLKNVISFVQNYLLITKLFFSKVLILYESPFNVINI